MSNGFHSIWDGWYKIPGADTKAPASSVVPESPASAEPDIDVTLSSDVESNIFSDVSGPLAALERSASGPNVLRFPSELGSDSNYAGRYAMRILVYKQQKSPTELGVVSSQNNPFDRTRKAAQQGRVNYSSFTVSGELLTDTRTQVIAGAFAAARSAKNAARTALRDVPIVGGLAEAGEQTVLAGAAYNAAEGLSGNPNNLTTQPLAYIHLFMPEQLNFVDRHDYDSVSVTDALGVQGLLAQGNATEFLGRVGERAALFGVNLLGQNFTELAIFNSGFALNPQLEVLYRKTNNREFVFNFRFIPKNQTDAQAIEDIIRTLRYHASPKFNTTGGGGEDGGVQITNSRYIIPPSQFEIEFITMDESGINFNDKLPRIASCVLSNVDVNYAPSGQFSAFEGDYPVETQMQLTFTETVILTKNDVAIGY